MTKKLQVMVSVAVAVVCVAAAWFWLRGRSSTPVLPEDPAIRSSLESVTNNFRKIIVLMDGAQDLGEAALARCRTTGRRIFYAKQEAMDDLATRLKDDYTANRPARILQTIQYVSTIRDADKLAFLDLFEDLQEMAGPAP